MHYVKEKWQEIIFVYYINLLNFQENNVTVQKKSKES